MARINSSHRMNHAKLTVAVCLSLVAISLSGFLGLREPVVSETVMASPGAGPSQEPRRLDLQQGANGKSVVPEQIIALTSVYGPVLFRVLPDEKGASQFELRFPGGEWTAYPEYTMDASYTMKKDGASCIRFEDPNEPEANYYNVCVDHGELKILAVGDVDPFS